MTTQKQQGIKKQLTKGFVKVAIIGRGIFGEPERVTCSSRL